MASIETNKDDWHEIRSRVDSIANGVFLIAGGALSVSISVILSIKGNGLITPHISWLASKAWYLLLASVVLFLLLKGHMVLEAYLLQFNASFVNRHLAALNRTAWALGLLGFAAFIAGLAFMVRAAELVAGAS